MKKKLLLSFLALFLTFGTLNSRVSVRRIGPDYRTEEQKEKEKEDGMGIGIVIAIIIGGLVIWGKMKNK